MKKSLIAMGLSTLLVFPGLTMVQAQSPRYSGPMMGGPGIGRPEMRGPGGGMRGSSKMHLNRLWRGIGQLEKGNSALNKAQARKVVALVRPWSNKPTMSDNEATNLTAQLSNVLTVAQKNQLKSMAEQRRSRMGDGNRRPGGPRANGPRGEGQGGDRRNGEGRGGPRGGGFDPQRMRQMMGFFRTMNPFYAPTGYKEYKSMPERMQKGMLRRYQTSRAILVSLSKKAG